MASWHEPRTPRRQRTSDGWLPFAIWAIAIWAVYVIVTAYGGWPS